MTVDHVVAGTDLGIAVEEVDHGKGAGVEIETEGQGQKRKREGHRRGHKKSLMIRELDPERSKVLDLRKLVQSLIVKLHGSEGMMKY